MARADPDRRGLRRAPRRPRRFARRASLNLLLDTHVLLWWIAGEPEQIGTKATEAIADADNRVLISAVVIWEVAIKRSLGKLDAPSNLVDLLIQAGVDLLPITARHAARVEMLPMHHRDPFDRLLVAQAEIEEFAIVSGDRTLERYGVDLLW